MTSNNKPELNEIDVWVRISILESKIQDNERRFERFDSSILEIHKKLDQLKDDLRNKKDIAQFDLRVEEIEKEVESIKLEFPEIRLVKKLVMGMIAFILTAFLGLIWNVVVINPTKNTSMNRPQENLNDIANKFVEEYKKGDKK